MTTRTIPDQRAVPESDRDLLVVYDDAGQAVRARDALLEAGVSGSDLRLDVEPDRVASLRVEMHEDLDGAWIVPQAELAHTNERVRGSLVMGAAGGAIGLVAAFPLALIGTWSSYPVRLVAWALLAMAFGGVVGMVAAPAIAPAHPTTQVAAAAKGTVLRVNHDSPQLRALLADLGPLRLDEATPDDQVAAPLGEGPRGLVETVREMADTARGDGLDTAPRPGPRR